LEETQENQGFTTPRDAEDSARCGGRSCSIGRPVRPSALRG
jgi:hypothetical protein